MDRRDFIRNTVSIAAGSLIPVSVVASEPPVVSAVKVGVHYDGNGRISSYMGGKLIASWNVKIAEGQKLFCEARMVNGEVDWVRQLREESCVTG